MSEEEASRLAKKMINSEFDFNDFLKQSQMMKGMGSLGGVANMIPGMAGKLTPEQINKVEVCQSRSTRSSCVRADQQGRGVSMDSSIKLNNVGRILFRYQ